MSHGVDLIAMERERQLKKWVAAHDDEHGQGELVRAAICYAAKAHHLALLEMIRVSSVPPKPDEWRLADPWPWLPSDDKRHRKGARELLVAAGAMIAAELDRLARIDAKRCPAVPCCEKKGIYNGYGTGPLLFNCPKDCSCHD